MATQLEQTDVVVVGAGLAGLMTALTLLDKGKKVVLIDRDLQENMGGQAKESFGGIFMCDSPIQRRMGIRDSHQLAYEDWCRFGELSEQEVLAKSWAKIFIEYSTPYILEGLRPYGVKFFPVVHWVERGLFLPGNSVPRFHMVWGTGHHLAISLAKGLSQHPLAKNLTMLFGHQVTELLSTNGAITGILGLTQDKKEFTVQADAVVVASGGVGANLDLVRRHWHEEVGPAPQTLWVGCHQYNDGSIHVAAEKWGAEVRNLDKMWNYAAGVPHYQPRKKNHGLSIIPPRSALWFNAYGKRIGPIPLITGFDTRFLCSQTARPENGPHTWQILNRKIAEKELAVSGAEHNIAIRDRKLFSFLKNILFGNKELVDLFLDNSSHFLSASNLPQLLDKMNCNNEGLPLYSDEIKNEISRYDEMLERGQKFHNDDQLRRITHMRQYTGDRARTCAFQKINDPGKGPLIAIKYQTLVRKSLGGLVTDLQCRVLNKKGQAISGLYAVGEASGFGGGGIHGKRTLEGTFLGNCIVNAMIAGRAISKGERR